MSGAFLCPGEEAAMPRRPNTPCRHPDCAALVPYGTKYRNKG